jgi:thioredoxin reductase (NADPH)
MDIAIIGAGPTGLFGAFYAGLRGMTVGLVDSLDEPGGQLAALYPEKFIYDVPGFPEVRAKELVDRLVAQADHYRPTYHLGREVEGLRLDPAVGAYLVQTAGGTLWARTVLIAAGVGAFRPKRLAVPDAERYEGRGLMYAVQSAEAFRGKRVLVVGGGDAAVESANRLAGVARHTTLVHRRDAFRADEESVAQMRAGPTRVLASHELRRLTGDDSLRQAIVYDNSIGLEEVIDVDAALVHIGLESSLGAIADWGLELRGGTIVVDHTMTTNRPGVFAAGDVCAYPGKIKLLANAFGEASTAVNHAAKFIDPSASVFPGHSTNMRRQ